MPAYTTESHDTGGRRQTVAVVVFLLLAVVVNYLPGEAQEQVASTLRSTVLRPFVLTQEGITAVRVRASEAAELRTTLDSLVAVSTARNTLEEENLRLRGLLSLSQRLGPGYRAATVVRPGTAGSESTFLIDQGAEDGLHAPAPVMTRQGLLGYVRDVGSRSATAVDWTHPDFRASAITLDGTTSGMVRSYRGDFREEDRLVLDGTTFHTTLDEGTIVVTSGLGGVFPRGIPIGRVRGLAEADAGWRKSYWLEPFVDPARATHVLVAVRGADTPPASDVRAAWPEDSIVTAEALARWDQSRRDSLAAVGDSLEVLRAILTASRAQDSLRQAVLGDTAPPISRPPPPTATAPEENEGGGAATRAVDTPTPRIDRMSPGRLRPPTDTVRIPVPDTGGAAPDTLTDTGRVRPDTGGTVARPRGRRPFEREPDRERSRAGPPGGGA